MDTSTESVRPHCTFYPDTWVLDVVPMMQQLLGCVECVSWQVLLGGE